jgi:dTDP-4-amino-4,6-dideoxygalactose transaminase
VIEVADNSPMSRDEIVRRFHAENVLVRRYFWPGCHNMMPYRELFPFAGLKLSNTNMVANRVISMPTGPAVTNHEIEATIDLFRMIQS